MSPRVRFWTVVAVVVVLASPAGAAVRYVAPNGVDLGDCTSSGSPCATPQYAADQSVNGDEIRLAKGTYTGVAMRPRADRESTGEVFQVLYLSKSVAVRGGFTTSNWESPDPVKNLTTLDAERLGRVVYVTGQSGPLLEGLRLTGGDADGQGGWDWGFDAGNGLYAYGSMPNIRNCQVIGNRNDRTVGGGISFWESHGQVSNSDIVDNDADTGGGLALYASDASIIGNTISGNRATSWGGGLYAWNCAPTVGNNAFYSNFADEREFEQGGLLSTMVVPADGAGAVFDAANPVVSSNTFFGNHAKGIGGAILNSATTGLFDGNVIRHNSAGNEAGGVGILWDSNSVFTNNVIADNRVTLDSSPPELAGGDQPSAMPVTVIAAGGVRVCSSQALLEHNTIANNHGSPGIGVLVGDGNPGPVTLRNNIISGHEVGLWVGMQAQASSQRNLWYDNQTQTGGPGSVVTLTGGGGEPPAAEGGDGISATAEMASEVSGDPRFINPEFGNYHVGANSAALDQAVPSTVAFDVDLESRPFNQVADIGADERAYGQPILFGSTAQAGGDEMAGDPLPSSGPYFHQVIAAAANTSGANDTRWQTDVDLFYTPEPGGGGMVAMDDAAGAAANGTDAVVEISVLKADQPNPSPVTAQVFVPYGETLRLANILGSTFKYSNAALGIRWLTGAGEANSRFYNTASLCGGTYGMYIPAERTQEALVFGNLAYFHHLAYSPNTSTGFRTNMGFANGTGMDTIVEIVLYGDNGELLASREQLVRAYEHLQITRIHQLWGTPAVSHGYAVVWVKTPGAWVHVYAMLIDNASGDPIYLRPLLSAPGLGSPDYDVMLSAAANTTGENGTRWLTDGDLFNPLPLPATVELALLKKNQANLTPSTAQFVIPPRQTVRLTNLLGSTFSTSNAAIGVRLVDRWVGVNSRFYNTASQCGGTYGMYIPGEHGGAAVGVGEAAFFHHVSYSAAGSLGFRTNVGFANNTAVATDVLIELFGDDGAFLASTTVTLQPYEHRQITRIHKELGTGNVDHGFIIVSVITPGGRVHTYAMLIDNASGDPVYMLPAVPERPWPVL